MVPDVPGLNLNFYTSGIVILTMLRRSDHCHHSSIMQTTLLLAISIGLSSVSVSEAWISGNPIRKLPSLFAKQVTEDGDSDDSNMSIVETLRRKAEQLRRDVDRLEKAKEVVLLEEAEKEQQIRVEKEELRHRYSALVPILKPDGSTVVERCDFSPRRRRDNGNGNNSCSFITTVEAPLPLGILLGECDDGSISIDDVAESGHGATAGLRPTDLVRALTACQMEMEFPTWQLLAGGIGRPKTKRFLYSADDQPLAAVMAAVASNRMDPERRPILLVIERDGYEPAVVEEEEKE
jgi:hypothetical protein